MQSILVVLLSMVFVSCSTTNNTKMEALGVLSESPSSYTQNLKVKNKKSYKKVVVNDRCLDQGGPQTYKTLLNVELEDVSEFDVWSNQDKNLLERVVIPVDAEPAVLSFKQEGCEAHGVVYELELSNELNMKDPDHLINFSVQFFEEWQANGLFSDEVLFGTIKEQFLKQSSGKEQTDVFTMNKENCKMKSKVLMCKFEEEPNELVLKIYNSDSRGKIDLKYWFNL
jgi:hypothetical protein